MKFLRDEIYSNDYLVFLTGSVPIQTSSVDFCIFLAQAFVAVRTLKLYLYECFVIFVVVGRRERAEHK